MLKISMAYLYFVYISRKQFVSITAQMASLTNLQHNVACMWEALDCTATHGIETGRDGEHFILLSGRNGSLGTGGGEKLQALNIYVTDLNENSLLGIYYAFG